MNKNEQLIVALLNEPTISAVAKRLKVNESTVFRMMNDETFKKEYREARIRLIENALNQLQMVSGEAIQTLREIMNDNGSPPNVRVNSAKTILEMGMKAFESQEIVERIARIEEATKDKSRRFA